MKTIYCLFLFIALCLPETIMSQSNSNETLLVGTWTFKYNASFKKMDASTKVHFDSIAPTLRSAIKNVYKGRKIIFKADGSFLQTLADGRSSKGKWVLTKNGNKVKITDPNGNKYIQKIKKLTASQLILKQENNGNSKMFFPEWHFTKN